MEQKIDDLLKSIYYDSKSEGSFSGVERLYQKAKETLPYIDREQVKKWLEQQLTYTLHKSVKRKFPRNRIIVSKIDEQWEADLVDMKEFAGQNARNNYILTVTDCFSKYAYACKITTKTGKNIVNAFKKFIRKRKPLNLRTDKGKEFLNKDFQTFLKENNINFFTSNDTKIKCAIVERFNRTLKEKMFKYFTSVGKRKYINVLPDLVESYNNSYHRSIKMRPSEVNEDNEKIVFKNIYGYESLRDLKMAKLKTPSLSAGDKVRIPYEHKAFSRGFYPNWTDQIFTIEQPIKGSDQIIFKIKDYEGNPIVQKFYPQELQKITESLHRLTVLKRRKRLGRKEVFVKWLNYPDSYNSWIPENDLQNLY